VPDKRHHRGPHPDDARLFAESWLPALRTAVGELSWLLTRGYAEESAVALVGNRYELAERQRIAVRRCACSDQALTRRGQARRPLGQCLDSPLAIDGYNLLITIESALSAGVVLIGRDGCYRDLASIHGTYRKVQETGPALLLIADFLRQAGVRELVWFLDRPVSNSGRLRAFMAEALADSPIRWQVELVDNPDPVLADYDGVVASGDSWILDFCRAWTNLAADIVAARLPDCWKLDLRVRGENELSAAAPRV
jgi:hypothetical protein